ncbi:MAG: J domain-containing protein [Allosphingosinicella sp.]|uniref:J domain-containing protein n=1 Tax=Allosphingosinicella sp. TaxID=2823234 RepID=UPI00394EE178
MSKHGGTSLYDVLGVTPGAEEVVIEAAYRALMKKYHPDQAGDGQAGRAATRINAAYAVLKDPTRRADYDHRMWLAAQGQIREAWSPPPRRFALGMAAWTGWAAALVLGLALIAVASGRLAAIAPPGLAVEVEEMAESPPSAAEAFFARAGAAIGLAGAPPAQAAVPPPAPVLAVPEPPKAAPRAMPRPAAAPRAAPPGDISGDREFREREGYIY